MPFAVHDDRFLIQRVANQLAEARGLADAQAVPVEARVGFLDDVRKATPGASAADVREALFGLWVGANEAKGEALRGSELDPPSAATFTPVDRGPGLESPLSLRMKALGGKDDGDPLQKAVAHGGVFDDVQERFFEPELEASLAAGADIPGTVQVGPTCGLQLLVSIFDGLQEQFPGDRALKNPLVRPEDADRPDSHTEATDTSETLLAYARSKGYTENGEIFTATDMAEIAEHFGYEATVTAGVTLDDIRAAVGRKHVAMIAIDVDRVGNPGLFDGARAHWVAVEGYFNKDGEDYLVGTHTWEGGEYVWRASDLLESTAQLTHADRELFPKAPADLTKTLAGRMIEISAPEGA